MAERPGPVRPGGGGFEEEVTPVLQVVAVPPRGEPRPTVIVMSGTRVGEVFLLDAFPAGLLIGRVPEANLRILDEGVSREHARITLQGAGGPSPEIADLGSRNGSWVNGQRVLRRALVEGDKVRVGEA